MSRIDVGLSASGTSFVFTSRILALAANPYHLLPLSRNASGISAAFGGSNSASSPFFSGRTGC